MTHRACFALGGPISGKVDSTYSSTVRNCSSLAISLQYRDGQRAAIAVFTKTSLCFGGYGLVTCASSFSGVVLVLKPRPLGRHLALHQSWTCNERHGRAPARQVGAWELCTHQMSAGSISQAPLQVAVEVFGGNALLQSPGYTRYPNT